MDSSVAVDLPDLTAQLDAWRQSHRKRARIPDHFYKTAACVARPLLPLLPSVEKRACGPLH